MIRLAHIYIVGGLSCHLRTCVSCEWYLADFCFHIEDGVRRVTSIRWSCEFADWQWLLFFQLGCDVHGSGTNQLQISLLDIGQASKVQVGKDDWHVVGLGYSLSLRRVWGGIQSWRASSTLPELLACTTWSSSAYDRCSRGLVNRLPIDSIGIPATPTVCSNCRCALEPQIPSIPFKLIVREVAYSHDAHLHFFTLYLL